MNCRPGCGACCIAISISTEIPGASVYKPAGTPCAQLDENLRCKIFNDPKRPACCTGLQPSLEMCGNNREEAMNYLQWLEETTKPGLVA